jgi:hypothetical protein
MYSLPSLGKILERQIDGRVDAFLHEAVPLGREAAAIIPTVVTLYRQ